MKLNLVLSLALFSCGSTEGKNFNILSLMSSNYNGYMSARFIEFIENTAYFSAISQQCIEERQTPKIAMHELFDFIAGSGTGAIIAGSLVVPNPKYLEGEDQFQQNANFANKSAEFFQKYGSQLYISQSIGVGWQILITVIFSALISLWVFACIRAKRKQKPGYTAVTNDLLLYVITQRDLLTKNKELDDLNDKTHEHIRSLVKEKGDAKLWKIFVDTQSILYDKLADNKKTDAVKALDHQESKLN